VCLGHAGSRCRGGSWAWAGVRLLTLGSGLDCLPASVGLGSFCGSGCCSCCSLGLGLGFGCCCSWRFSGSPSCIAPAFCETTRPPPSCLEVTSLSCFLTSFRCAAPPTLAVARTSAVISLMPIPLSTLSLSRSSD